MGGAIRFDRPTGQQQTENDTKNQLFLFRQAIHGANCSGTVGEVQQRGHSAKKEAAHRAALTGGKTMRAANGYAADAVSLFTFVFAFTFALIACFLRLR